MDKQEICYWLTLKAIELNKTDFISIFKLNDERRSSNPIHLYERLKTLDEVTELIASTYNKLYSSLDI